ncbi:MAG TPA: PQQ-binding-like beta-propeller repeat protein [Acidimicrobiia bacterium]|nr:PQQ-binding-like beta-propeller repeat protein [Acidimicrobiia bacterium]
MVRGAPRGTTRHARALTRLACVAAVALVAAACTAPWTTYHVDNTREGSVSSGPTPPVANKWTSGWIDGWVYAQPLVYNNRVYVATENNSVYALDLQTGAVDWRVELGPPVSAASVPCPLDIDPLGITGTPVIDPSTNTIYVVTDESGTKPAAFHELVGLDTETGAVRVRVSGDPPGVDPVLDHQRPALALANGRVYWEYGGADCGTYHGKVVSVRTDGTDPLVYTVPSINRGSIWGPSGPAVDSNGNIWVSTGDGTSTMTYDYTTSVLELSPDLQLLGYFAPSNWATLNQNGQELGSTGPLLLPGGYVFQVGKSGDAYLLSQANPGGIGGQLASLSIGCNASGGNAYSNGVVYVACLTGTVAVSIDPGPSMHVLWRSSVKTTGSPIVAGSTVWTMLVDQGVLYAFDAKTGAIQQQLTIGQARHFMSPTVSGNLLVVGTSHTVQAFQPAS